MSPNSGQHWEEQGTRCFFPGRYREQEHLSIKEPQDQSVLPFSKDWDSRGNHEEAYCSGDQVLSGRSYPEKGEQYWKDLMEKGQGSLPHWGPLAKDCAGRARAGVGASGASEWPGGLEAPDEMQIKKLGEKEDVKTKKGDPEPWAQPHQPSLPRLSKSCPVPLFPHPLHSYYSESEGLIGSRISLSWSEHRVR